ncbi:hypothetical protein O181_035352 [Austropuccinia psidii MF-1]|uniref:Uncharacterized protein n=1 Tax=Austropuccinia psidii MF-1 TaxID=1389203 RepID=A0A9Q3D509_9BASI|nr:hypothetical protein [Austropuccinia psidii MF-1]
MCTRSDVSYYLLISNILLNKFPEDFLIPEALFIPESSDENTQSQTNSTLEIENITQPNDGTNPSQAPLNLVPIISSSSLLINSTFNKNTPNPNTSAIAVSPIPSPSNSATVSSSNNTSCLNLPTSPSATSISLYSMSSHDNQPGDLITPVFINNHTSPVPRSSSRHPQSDPIQMDSKVSTQNHSIMPSHQASSNPNP